MSLEHQPTTKRLRSASGHSQGKFIRITVTKWLTKGTYEVTVYITDEQPRSRPCFTTYEFHSLGEASSAYHSLVDEYGLKEENRDG